MLKNFMNKRTPYKSLLIFHGVGVGKTCSAVKISESFRDLYSFLQVTIYKTFLHNSSQDNKYYVYRLITAYHKN